MKSWRGLALSIAILACAASPALTQDYPSKPIRILVGFAAGGGTDILAREVAAHLQKVWGKPVVVENRPGANGNIATSEMARSAPDGYTLLVTVPSLITNAFLDPNFKYKPLDDFAPVTVIGKAAYVITVTPSFPAKNLRELIAMAKEKPGSINYGTAGVGSSPHLTAELFNAAAGISMTAIPYRGASQVVTDVISGQIPLSFFTTVQVLPLLKDGRLRGLAVTGRQRSKFVPDLPTASEAGVPGYKVRRLVGDVRARRDAEAHHRQTPAGNLADPEHTGDEGAPHRPWLRAGRQHARAIRGSNEARIFGVGGAIQEGQDKDRVTWVASYCDGLCFP